HREGHCSLRCYVGRRRCRADPDQVLPPPQRRSQRLPGSLPAVGCSNLSEGRKSRPRGCSSSSSSSRRSRDGVQPSLAGDQAAGSNH
ncbi:Hypothetical predicted protein, partial [Podarcis lilfordi]